MHSTKNINKERFGEQDMPVMDEFKRERDIIKDKSFKEKLNYFLYYYKMHLLVAVCVLFFGIILIRDVMSAKDFGFYAAFLNAYSTEQDEAFIGEFAALTDINLDEYEVFLDSSIHFDLSAYDKFTMASAQKFLAMSSAGEIDVVISDRDIFATYADNGTFLDLRTCLTDEQLEKYADHFFYFDSAILNREFDPDEAAEGTFAIPTDEAERRNPEDMTSPIPVGIFLDDEMKSRLTEVGYYKEEDEIIFGIMAEEDHMKYCQQFLDWLIEAE